MSVRMFDLLCPAPRPADRGVVRVLQQIIQPADDSVKVGADVAVHPEEVGAAPARGVVGLAPAGPDAVRLVRVFDQHGRPGPV